MKWRVDIEYEDGSFTEPRRIAFQAVYDGEPYHGYDTKKEALEAFCVGQVVMREMLKEREAEQKEAEQKCGEICGDNRFEIIKKAKKHLIEATNIETSKDEMACLDSFLFRCWQMGWLKQYEQKEAEGNKEWKHFAEATDEQKEKADELKKQMSNILRNDLRGGNSHWEESIDVVRDFSPYGKTAIFDTSKPTIEERLEKIEQRLTEVEGVLSSIGSPEYDLRKKVEGLEEKVKALDEWKIRHLMIFHDKPLTEEQQKKVDKLFWEQTNN